jgi:hypothetical protein
MIPDWPISIPRPGVIAWGAVQSLVAQNTFFPNEPKVLLKTNGQVLKQAFLKSRAAKIPETTKNGGQRDAPPMRQRDVNRPAAKWLVECALPAPATAEIPWQ